MTTTVIVQAHCSPDKEVLVAVDAGNHGETIRLQNGETAERYAYDDRQITVREVLKVPGQHQAGNASVGEMLDSAPTLATGDAAIEQQIQAKGLTAPRITPADIAANIACETYFTAHDGVCGCSHNERVGVPTHDSLRLLTFCVLVLKNGFTVTGESACASPENFDAEIGRKVARDNAINKVWPLMGYALKERLSKPLVTDGSGDIALLRSALAGLVGVDTEEELRQMEATMRVLPAPEADKAVTINAIHALLATKGGAA